MCFNQGVAHAEQAGGRRGRTNLIALGAVVVGLVGLVGVLVALANAGPATPTAALPAPRFIEGAADAGIAHTYDGEFEFFVGGGVAAFDCDDDGLAELYFAGGVNPAALYHNDSAAGGSLAFSALPNPATDLTGVAGAYPIDVDGDGVIDLAVLRSGENAILRGLGGCRFERANETWGIDGGAEWTAAFSAAWEGDADLPTLAFGNYVAADAIDAARDLCADNVLLRPDSGTGRYADPLALSPGFCTLSILFSDWDRSGERDLRMANDRHYYRDGHEQLWRIRAGAEPAEYTEADGWKTMLIWGMGIASQDLTGDGRPEVLLTSQGDNKLQTLDADATGPSYHDMALELGATAHRPFAGGDVLPSTAWHPEFADVNNDGYMDLFISKGNVEAMNEYAAKDPNNLLIGQPDGTFVEGAEAADILDFARSRGAALVDLNLDGLLDLVVVERREHAKVWRNVGAGDAATPAAMGHWVAVELSQPGPNVDAIGAWVEVRVGDHVVRRERTIGGGHAGGQLGWIHFGIGEADRAEVRVQWPDGEVGPWVPLKADELVTVKRGESAATPWAPGT